ncbi:anthranilate synthase family protein [Rathayibacter festucae]|uniref:anthranilate synthase family protein n=1 Tax=Rathayibacter festucae TaxID=110937 RepID=UPI002A6B3AD6|nr:chorismate-binding protein [Rathayibacter festucae]MDY0913897.1 chorismate-binding protein [Rathayibacter festucae]
MTSLLSRILASDGSLPFAVVLRQGRTDVDVFTGDVVDVEGLADIPLDGADVLTLVPYRQVRERGFAAKDDGAPLRNLVVRERESVPLAEVLRLLPEREIPVEERGFDVPDEEYAEIVRRVIDDEIGRGEGANFVINRAFVAHTDAPAVEAVLAWFRRLLTDESGAYWTFAIHTPGADGSPAVTAVGATPERHVSVRDGVAMMNPISGTFRHPAAGPTGAEVLAFLADVKESEELFMVVDEEMKMMSAVCPNGGRILGPFLKQMSRLSHTEYLLEGRTDLDVREVLRLTMFAPTVTGSPMENACAVIAEYEKEPRGYYSGVLALFEPEEHGYTVDAPILIRTAYLREDGRLTVPAGATLVRHSTPEGEVAETRAKASGVLSALGLLPHRDIPPAIDLNAQPGVQEALEARNERLASFWLRPQAPEHIEGLAGHTALIVDNEDQFTTMLAHQLRHLGMDARVERWSSVEDVLSDDLVVFGPGPGDPRDDSEPRIARLRALMTERLASERPMLAVCLSHQMLSLLAGLPVEPLPAPRQGVRLAVDVFGEDAAIGFYNTFSSVAGAEVSSTPLLDLEISRDPATGIVDALRGEGIASVQGHLESVLSSDGLRTLERLVRTATSQPARA